MKNLKQLAVALTLILGCAAQAQENAFLSQDFWKTNPTIEMVDAKVKAGNDISEFNGRSFNGVVYAILQDAPLKTIKHSVALDGNKVNKLTHDGRTYIFWAAYKGNVKLMKHLLSKGAKTDILDDKGSTILNFAAGSGQTNTKVYDLCLANGANLKKDLTPYGANALLLVAPSAKDFTLIEYFTKKGLPINSVDAKGNGLFNYVAKSGNIELLKQLVNSGITGNDNAFITASQGTRSTTNGVDVFNYLESAGLHPNVTTDTGETPLHALASRTKESATLTYFIEKGVDVNQEDTSGNTAFLNAIQRNDLDVIQLLFKHVNTINHQNKKGESALTLAVAHNTPEVVNFLIANNADVMVTDANGNTLTPYLMESFSVARKEAFKRKLNALSAKGLEVAKAQKNGNTVFHLALDSNNLELITFAAGLNTDVNAENNEGLTPLHKAAMLAKDTEILKYLVSIGAEKETVTDFEETAYDLASENEILKANNIAIEFLK
ncbi:ankyrin repeat domain-containing protein [Bizionia saleffrena]|uniref:Ankyrin repeat domain-containing protein n=1 Tax=Bizionia saleffrena TaxID=291189 RepID=A0A8H2QLS0_9FLAO|nr:ankyrin repeat domain-containing protein [Bizionia saleffrena]TYB75944.1 ankyrin repeat domain-containing protein [Bizionia saleffrena]